LTILDQVLKENGLKPVETAATDQSGNSTNLAAVE
jgi:hypothetical protein